MPAGTDHCDQHKKVTTLKVDPVTSTEFWTSATGWIVEEYKPNYVDIFHACQFNAICLCGGMASMYGRCVVLNESSIVG